MKEWFAITGQVVISNDFSETIIRENLNYMGKKTKIRHKFIPNIIQTLEKLVNGFHLFSFSIFKNSSRCDSH